MATLEQVEKALRAADAAGNTEDAKRLAQAYAQMRSQQAKPDFSGVSSQAQTTADGRKGPLVPSATARAQPSAPSLDELNAANRAATSAPGWQERRDAEDVSYAQAAFQRAPAPVRALAGAGGRLAALYRGAEQLGAAGLDAIAPREQTLSSLVTGGVPSRYEEAQQREAEARQRDRNMEGDVAAGLGGIAADIGMYAMPLSKLGNLSRGGQYAASVGTGAVAGGLQPTVEGESRGLNAGVGAGLGLLGQGGSEVVMGIGKRAAAAISPELRELGRFGESVGLPLTGADVAKSEAAKRMAMLADSMPFSGAASRQDARSGAIGKQLAKLIGQDADQLNQGVMARAYDDLGRQYDEFFKDGMQVDRAFVEQLDGVRDFAAGNLDDAAIRAASNFVERVKAQLQDGGRISGETLQSLDQQARKLAIGGGDRQHVMTELRQALHGAFGRQSGNPEAWRELNRKYANYKTIEPLIARNPEGIAPEQLLQAVNANKQGKARMARGQAGDIGDLAMLGRQMRPPRTSKTAENLMNLGLLGGGLTNPTIAVPLALAANIGGRFLNSPAAGRFLMREGRGQGAQAVAPYLQRGGALAPLVTPETEQP